MQMLTIVSFFPRSLNAEKETGKKWTLAQNGRRVVLRRKIETVKSLMQMFAIMNSFMDIV